MSTSSCCASRLKGRRQALALLALPLLGALPAQAQSQTQSQPQAALPELPGWSQRSRGRLRFLGVKVYEIALWSPQPVGAAGWAEQPLALALSYARPLKGQAIAERSLAEMRRQGEIDTATAERWLNAMRAAFPDVKKGDRLTGRHDPQQGAQFWLNGQPRPGVAEPEFSRRFFGIWLSPQTSEPGLRGKLLGLSP